MAIAFAQSNIHSRAKGHSAVAACAYRTASKLLDERTGITYDFTHRTDVKFTETLLPERTDVRFKDNGILWNAVETSEKRVDSQVCKDIILALPKELDLTNQIELAKRFANTHFVSEGIPCTVAIHDHGDGNPHAHLLITTRRLEQNQFSKYKARDLNPSFYSGKVIEGDYWGEQWRTSQQDFFNDYNLDLSVDLNHVIPERHEGRIREDANHYLKHENGIIKQQRIHLALNDIDNIINHISLTHSVFTRRDVERLIFKTLGNNDANHLEFTALVEQVLHHKTIIALGANDEGLDSFTTRNQYLSEALLLKQVDSMSSTSTHLFSADTHALAQSYQLNDEQTQALEFLVKGSDLSAMVGRPGVGKSYLLKPLGEYYKDNGCRVLGCALSGKVAKSLQSETNIPSFTIASLTYRLNHNLLSLNRRDVLIVDEAGMVDFASMSSLIDAAFKAHAKIILIGDPNQLKPIHKGEIFKGILSRTGYIELCNIRRQRDLGDRQASLALSKGDIDSALAHYDQKGAIHFSNNPHDCIEQLVADWQTGIHSRTDIKEHALFAFTRTAVATLNTHARCALQNKGLLSLDEVSFTQWRDNANDVNHQGSHLISIAVGERLLLRKNDKKLGVRNGDFAFVEACHSSGLTVRLDSGEIITLPRTYHHLDYGYATTVHKGQGMTVDKAKVLIDSQYWDRNLSFVAMTRHRDELSLYVDTAQHPDLNALKKTLSRESTKDNVIDWPLDFAIRAGFDPDKMVGRALNHMAGIAHKIREQWNYVVHFEAYLKSSKVQTEINQRQEKRSVANDVARYLDEKSVLRQDIATHKKAQDIQGDVVSTQSEMDAIYVRSVARDKQAHELLQKHRHQLESIPSLSSSLKGIKTDAGRYDRYLALKEMIALPAHTEPSSGLCERLARIDLSKDYIHIRHLSHGLAPSKTPTALYKQVEDAQTNHRQVLFDKLKEEHPILAEYSQLVSARTKAVGFESERLDKAIFQKAKDITGNKALYGQLKQTLPKIVTGLLRRIKEHGIDHER